MYWKFTAYLGNAWKLDVEHNKFRGFEKTEISRLRRHKLSQLGNSMNEIRFKDSQVLSSEKDSSFYLTQQILITDCNGKEHSNDIRQQEHKYLERFGKIFFIPLLRVLSRYFKHLTIKTILCFISLHSTSSQRKGEKKENRTRKKKKFFWIFSLEML